ncbi:MAG: hypothetical protein H7234_04880 [Herminiimonas sp.]|nr:hypothetical protein [Herminiimonas sp.]
MQTFGVSTLAVVICQAFANGTHTGISNGRRRRHAAPAAIVAAAVTGLLACVPAHAIGLGELQVQSGLGQGLRATIGVLGSDPAARPASCYTARLSTADGAFIVSPRIALVGVAGGSKLVLATSVALSEPALSLLVEVACGDAVRKEFMLLLDPPLVLAAPLTPDRPARVARLPAPAAQRAAVLPLDVTPNETAPSETAIVSVPAPTTVPARPSRPRPVAATPVKPAADKAPAGAAPSPKPARSVLRMGARASAADTALINPIGLRLADRLAGSNAATPGTGNAADAASLAADRAARARFVEALRGDAGADPMAETNEQRLQQLQAKTRLLEKEVARLKQLALQDAAARAAAVHDGSDRLLLAGLVALLVASLVAIAWLARRMKHLQRRNSDWDWDENVSAADARAAHTEPAALSGFNAALTLEEEAHAESAAREARTTRAEAEARELRQARAEADARHSLDDTFWETSAAPVSPPVAPPVIKPASTWAGAPAAVSADLAELGFLANAVGSRSAFAIPIAPVVAAAVAAKLEPVTPAAAPEIAASSAPSAPAAPLEMMPMTFLPDLDFPETPIAPLEFNTTTTLPTALKAPALQTVALQPLPLPVTPAPVSPKVAGPDDLQFAEIRMQSTSVEEISDIMQEAEFWLSLHDLERAAEVLEPYATYEQPGSPLPWLYLFELYRDLGWQEKYDSLRDRFQRIFNGRALTWDEQKHVLPGTPRRGVEDVPHVALKLTTLWQSEEVIPYLESLLVDDRDGTRAGFDLPVYKEIMFLILLAYEQQQSKQYLEPALGTPGTPILA